MVERFDLSREQPQKEWWRERRIAPATFFGFPDVTKHNLRGGSLYVEQMDSVTLAVLMDKCLQEKITDPEMWTKFCWRAQQIACRTYLPDLCYIFRAFARADWFDQNFITTYLGRVHHTLHSFRLVDVSTFLQALHNAKFRQGTYLNKALTHLLLLLQHRDDATPKDLAKVCLALRGLQPLQADLCQEVLMALELLAEGLLLRDLSELGASRAIHVIDSYVAWGLVTGADDARSRASVDLCWALVRELKGSLTSHSKEKPDDLGTLALALAAGGLAHADLWTELAMSLENTAHRLTGPAAAAAAHGVGRSGKGSHQLFENLGRRIIEQHATLSALDCARAAGGFLRRSRRIAEAVVLDGPIADRILHMGLEAFEAEHLTILLDSLSRAPPSAERAEQMGAMVLEALHARLDELSGHQLISVVRSLGHLQPQDPTILSDVLDRAQAAAVEDDGTNMSGQIAPRHVAMLCQGIASQPASTLSDGPKRLHGLLPVIKKAATSNPTPLTAAQLLGSLRSVRQSPERDHVLTVCAEHLTNGACELSVHKLISVSEWLASLRNGTPNNDGGGWQPPQSTLSELAVQLDMKRYDASPGVLWRAAQALEQVGMPPGALTLESRDSP